MEINSQNTNDINVGTAGHFLKKVVFSMNPEEKKKLVFSSGCPINKNTEAKLTEACFIKMCKIHRKAIKKKQCMNEHGFKGNNEICADCDIGIKVEMGEPFDPPPKIIFIELNTEVPIIKKPKLKFPKTNLKLDTDDVLSIRKRHADGETINFIHKTYPQVGRTAISKIVNRVNWKHI